MKISPEDPRRAAPPDRGDRPVTGADRAHGRCPRDHHGADADPDRLHQPGHRGRRPALHGVDVSCHAGLGAGAHRPGIIGYQLPMSRATRHFRRAREATEELMKTFRALTRGVKELELHARRREAFLATSLEGEAGVVQASNLRGMVALTAANGWGPGMVFTIIGVTLFVVPLFQEASTEASIGYAARPPLPDDAHAGPHRRAPGPEPRGHRRAEGRGPRREPQGRGERGRRRQGPRSPRGGNGWSSPGSRTPTGPREGRHLHAGPHPPQRAARRADLPRRRQRQRQDDPREADRGPLRARVGPDPARRRGRSPTGTGRRTGSSSR